MTITREVAILCVGLLIANRPYTLAQTPPNSPQNAAQPTLSPDQLDSLVAPVALYPDPILSQVLVASTYPLEIVEAARWMTQNAALKGKQLTDAAAKQSWDASVQALVALPDLLTQLNRDISWTSSLGNAFLAQQAGVMEAVQRMRQKAQAKGTLQSTPQQTVNTVAENNQSYIEIQPASPDVVYIPQYNPVAVWGPAEYYPYPAIYYPPVSTGALVAASAISFGVGVAIGAIWSGGWNNWGWNCGWGRNNIVVNNNFINNNHFNRTNIGSGNAWVHNPAHRGGVPYANRNVADRFNRGGSIPSGRPTASQVQQRLSQGSAARLNPGNLGPGGTGRPNPGALNPGANKGLTPGNLNRPGQGSANRLGPGGAGQFNNQIGNRNLGGGSLNRGAFAGMDMGGGRARMNSNRGFASRGGGGFRGGGFGGGGRRGGGRRR